MARPTSLPQLQSLSLDAVFALLDGHLDPHETDPPSAFVVEYLRDAPGRVKDMVAKHITEVYLRACSYADAQTNVLCDGGDVAENFALMPDPRMLVRTAASLSRVTRLDLSGLKRVGFFPSTHVSSFREELLLAIPQLPALASLDLSTIRRPHQVRGAGRKRQSKQGPSKGVKSGNVLPSVGDEHLLALGRHCRTLQHLNVSFNDITAKGLLGLVPREEGDEGERTGCPELKELHLFECLVGYKEMSHVAVGLSASLTFLGYKETGKMLKYLHNNSKRGHDVKQTDEDEKEEDEEEEHVNPVPPSAGTVLRLTHVNNMGSKVRKLVAAGLRCKRPMAEAIAAVAPEVANLKVRVNDNDVEHLSVLQNLRTVELLFNHGNPSNCQGPKTELFLRARGELLTSLAIISPSASMISIQVIGQNCPNLRQLWQRCNVFNGSLRNGKEHGFFSKLEILYFRVGENNLFVSTVSKDVVRYILRNAGGTLKELILPMRAPAVLESAYMTDLLLECGLTGLEKVLLLVPGVNDTPGVLKLNVGFLEFLLDFCPSLRKVGNLLTWTVTPEDCMRITASRDGGGRRGDLELVHRIMTMH